MKFDLNAYEKVFPAQQPTTTTDSAVDGYNPTADEANGAAQTKDSAVDEGATQPNMGATTPSNGAQPPKTDENTYLGINNPVDGTTPPTGKLDPIAGD